MAGRYQRNGGPTSSMATACRHFLPLLDDPQIGRRDEQHDQAEQDAAAAFGHLQDGEQRRQHGEDQRADDGRVMSPRSPLPGTSFRLDIRVTRAERPRSRIVPMWSSAPAAACGHVASENDSRRPSLRALPSFGGAIIPHRGWVICRNRRRP